MFTVRRSRLRRRVLLPFVSTSARPSGPPPKPGPPTRSEMSSDARTVARTFHHQVPLSFAMQGAIGVCGKHHWTGGAVGIWGYCTPCHVRWHLLPPQCRASTASFTKICSGRPSTRAVCISLFPSLPCRTLSLVSRWIKMFLFMLLVPPAATAAAEGRAHTQWLWAPRVCCGDDGA